MKTALITGASGGIGMELAIVHAAKGGNVILVARNLDKLLALKEALESAHQIKTWVIDMDLTEPTAPATLYDKIKAENIEVEYLVNNAGFGLFGAFAETNWQREKDMIQLNIACLTELTKLFLHDMVARKSGRILNVASVASFLPGPMMSVYYATKAYVLHFSEAIDNEVKQHNIRVTALCPGATTSGFQQAADLGDSKLFANKKLPSSKDVAIYGHKAMLKGKPVAIHGFKNRFMVWSIRLTPRFLVTKIVRKIQDKK
jgi:short-subunit dehydrogenase